MTALLEFCEPVFQYVCRLNRLARKGGHVAADEVRSQLKALLTDARAKAQQQPGMGAQFEKVELPLIFFCDSMIRESKLSFAGKWQDLAAERNELAGDEKFYDLLEETLADKSDQAAERLTVFYSCLGLGFTGWYAGQPEYLRKKMMEIAGRVRGKGMETDTGSKLCPDAYEHVNTSNLIEPPGRSLIGIGIALAALAIVLFLTNAQLYRGSAGELKSALGDITSAVGKEAKP